MKKLNYLVRSVRILNTLLTGCKSKKLEYYMPYFFFEVTDKYEKDPYEEKSLEISAEQKEIVLMVFRELCDIYQIQKEYPNAKILTNSTFNEISGCSSRVIKGIYGGKGTIYLREGFSKKDSSVICHELCHYLSEGGFAYTIREKYVNGYALNEGFTNYFSTRLYPHSENVSAYEFETFIASQLVVIFGEDRVRDIYFKADVSSLRDDFNSCLKGIYPKEEYSVIKFEPFDIMCSALNVYNYYFFNMNHEEMNNIWCMQSVDCVEEMILNYAEQKGKKKECQKLLEEFLNDEDAILWTVYSNLNKMH